MLDMLHGSTSHWIFTSLVTSEILFIEIRSLFTFLSFGFRFQAQLMKRTIKKERRFEYIEIDYQRNRFLEVVSRTQALWKQWTQQRFINLVRRHSSLQSAAIDRSAHNLRDGDCDEESQRRVPHVGNPIHGEIAADDAGRYWGGRRSWHGDIESAAFGR